MCLLQVLPHAEREEVPAKEERAKMRALLIGAALAGSLISVQAAELSLPKELHGKWCAASTATGGGSPRFWEYERSKDRSCPKDREDARLKDEDMVLGARTHNNCWAIAGFEWKEENLPVYFMTYRCKSGHEYTAKYTTDSRDDDHLTVQYFFLRR